MASYGTRYDANSYDLALLNPTYDLPLDSSRDWAFFGWIRPESIDFQRGLALSYDSGLGGGINFYSDYQSIWFNSGSNATKFISVPVDTWIFCAVRLSIDNGPKIWVGPEGGALNTADYLYTSSACYAHFLAPAPQAGAFAEVNLIVDETLTDADAQALFTGSTSVDLGFSPVVRLTGQSIPETNTGSDGQPTINRTGNAPTLIDGPLVLSYGDTTPTTTPIIVTAQSASLSLSSTTASSTIGQRSKAQTIGLSRGTPDGLIHAGQRSHAQTTALTRTASVAGQQIGQHPQATSTAKTVNGQDSTSRIGQRSQAQSTSTTITEYSASLTVGSHIPVDITALSSHSTMTNYAASMRVGARSLADSQAQTIEATPPTIASGHRAYAVSQAHTVTAADGQARAGFRAESKSKPYVINYHAASIVITSIEYMTVDHFDIKPKMSIDGVSVELKMRSSIDIKAKINGGVKVRID